MGKKLPISIWPQTFSPNFPVRVQYQGPLSSPMLVLLIENSQVFCWFVSMKWYLSSLSQFWLKSSHGITRLPVPFSKQQCLCLNWHISCGRLEVHFKFMVLPGLRVTCFGSIWESTNLSSFNRTSKSEIWTVIALWCRN